MSAGPRTVICRDEAATLAEGERLAGELVAGDVVSLEGELGAGKTVLVRGLARGLGLDANAVTSPSFVLAIEHPGGRLPLIHCDLYRLPEGSGIDDLGIEDALARGWVAAVEWGERLPWFLREAAWRVVMAAAPAHGEDARSVVVIPPPH